MRRARAHLGAAALLAALLVGCSGTDASDEAAATPTAEDAEPSTEEPDPADEPTEASDEPREAAGPIALDLDEEQRTANGTVFRVHGLEVDDLSILVDVEIIVAADGGDIRLNTAIGGTESVIRDDHGNEYPLVPPEGNRNLTLQEGERLEGTLVYQGPLHDGVGELTLFFNESSDAGGGGMMNQMYPNFTFGPFDISS